MQSMDGIPTAPNSPSYSRVASAEPHADRAATDFSDFDMMSSIESLPRGGERAAERAADSPAAGSPSPRLLTSYGFIMPSLPSLPSLAAPGDHTPPGGGLVGRLHIVVCGAASRSKLIDTLCRDVFGPPYPPALQHDPMLDTAFEHRVCSSSAAEHNNLTLVNCDVPAAGLAAWLDAQFRRAANSALQPTIDALLYVFDGEPDDKELLALAEAQKYAAVVPVTGVGSDADALCARLRAHGVSPLLKRVWTVATELVPNFDMSASAVEAPGYRSEVLPPSELPKLVDALLAASGRARAHTAQLYARWVQAQLALTSPEPPGALVVRVNLRKSLESIGNLDPLGLSQWCTMPRLFGAVIAGMAAAVGLSAAWARLFPVVPAPPVQYHRHLLLDNVLENWTQWLRA